MRTTDMTVFAKALGAFGAYMGFIALALGAVSRGI